MKVLKWSGLAGIISVSLILGTSGSVSAANVWLQKTQLEQFWVGSQWRDSTSDTNSYNANGLVATVAKATNIAPNGLINDLLIATDYDAEDEPIQQLNRSYDKTQGVWADTISGTKWTRYKDSSKRDTVVESQTWDAVSAKWYKARRSATHYTAQGLVDTMRYAVWDTAGGVGKWLNTSRIATAYDASEQPVLEINDGWDKANQRWIKITKVSRVFNTAGLVVADTTALWDTAGGTGKYVYSLQHQYMYNAGKKDTTTITLSYSRTLDDFLNVTRDVYAYDNNSNQTVWTNYGWTKDPQNNGMWLAIRRETSTFNAGSQILTTTWETYDSTGAKWNSKNLEEWAYDGNKNAQSETFSTWDTTLNPDDWALARKLNWTYIQMNIVGTRQPISLTDKDHGNITLRATQQRLVITGIRDLKASVFGMNGRKVASVAAGKGATSIAWNFADAYGIPVTPGSYLVRITAPGFSASHQVMVAR